MQNLNLFTLIQLRLFPFTYISFAKIKITHVHEILSNKQYLNKFFNKLTLWLSSYIICVSTAVFNNLYSLSNSSKLHLVQNGVHFSHSTNTVNNISSLFDSDYLKFSLVGRIKPSRKGQLLLIEAISLLDSEDLEKAHFYLIGSTTLGEEYVDEINNVINSNNLSNHISIIPLLTILENNILPIRCYSCALNLLKIRFLQLFLKQCFIQNQSLVPRLVYLR